tara:strand:- start:14 stop:214 length:201 start_codon:yes stop_codon:yes gene_type:complete
MAVEWGGQGLAALLLFFQGRTRRLDVMNLAVLTGHIFQSLCCGSEIKKTNADTENEKFHGVDCLHI